MQHLRIIAPANGNAGDHGTRKDMPWRTHSTPDPDAEPPAPNPNPDNVPPPAHAPVQEPPGTNEPPIKARRN